MLKNLKWGALITSLIFIAAGILLIIYPDVSAKLICDIIGIACIVMGIINITTYFMLDLKDSLYRNDFVIGVLVILLGTLVIYKKNLVLELIPFILGIVIVASGFAKLQDGIDANRIGYKKSWIYIVMAAVSIAFGLVIMFSIPASTTTEMLFRIIGVALLYSGATDLYSAIYLSTKIKRFMKKAETVVAEAAGNVVDVTPVPEVEEPTTPTPTDSSETPKE